MREAGIDWARADVIAQIIRDWNFNVDLYDWMAPPAPISDDEYISAAFFAAAVCHSTQGGLRGYFDKTYYKGWDYLLRAFLVATSRGLLGVGQCRALSGNTLREVLGQGADSSVVGLNDLDHRSAILQGLAAQVVAAGARNVPEALGLRRSVAQVGGGEGLYERLAGYQAFSDMQRKKATTFLMTVHFSRRVVLSDPENVDPMVDYHRMRLFLRLGCIIPSDDDVESLRLRRGVAIEASNSIRERSYELSRWFSGACGKPALELDVVMWAFARSACRDTPVCQSRQYQNGSFQTFTRIDGHTGCSLGPVCGSSKKSVDEMLWEPVGKSEDY
jgi:hypothetical protein